MPRQRGASAIRHRVLRRLVRGTIDLHEECKVIGTDILTVQYAWPVGKPLVDNLGDAIWEVRSRLDNRIARTLFAVVDQEIVLLHGFIKKQQKTPPDELDLAKKRKKQYLQNL